MSLCSRLGSLGELGLSLSTVGFPGARGAGCAVRAGAGTATVLAACAYGACGAWGGPGARACGGFPRVRVNPPALGHERGWLRELARLRVGSLARGALMALGLPGARGAGSAVRAGAGTAPGLAAGAGRWAAVRRRYVILYSPKIHCIHGGEIRALGLLWTLNFVVCFRFTWANYKFWGSGR